MLEFALICLSFFPVAAVCVCIPIGWTFRKELKLKEAWQEYKVKRKSRN